jgi:hypothetical protein
VGQPGFSNVLGTKPDRPDGPDILIEGLFCGACGKIFNDARNADEASTRNARRQAIQRLRLQVPALTDEDIRLLFKADD